MLNLILTNAALLVTSALLALRIFPESHKSRLAALSYSFFIYLTLIVSLQTLFGALGNLNIINLSIATYSLSALTLVKYRKLFKKFKPPKLRPSKSHLLPIIIFLPLAAFCLVEIYNAIVLPVWEFDSIAYHMPMIRHYAEAGNLWDVFYSAYAGPVAYYPASGDLLFLWTVLPFGTDTLVNIPNTLLLPIFALSAYFFARQLKLDKGPSLLFAAFLSYSPVILKEVGTIHVDLFLSLSLVYILLFLHKFITKKNPFHIITTAAALGLFIGTKYLAVPFALLPTAIFIYYIIKNFKKSQLKYVLAALGISILTGAFWYIRNWVVAKNPLFPAEFLGFTGYKDLTEHIKTLSLTYNFHTMGLEQLQAYTERYFFRTGAGALLIPIAFLSLITGLISKKLRAKLNPRLGTLFVISIPLFFYLYLSAPYTYNDFDANIRYSLPLLLIGFLLVGYLINQFPKLRISTYILAAIAVTWSFGAALKYDDRPHELFDLTYIQNFGQIPNKYAVLRHKYPESFHQFFNTYEWIEKNIPTEKRLAYTGSHFHYYLYHIGQSIDRKVEYINVNDCQDCKYHDYGSDPAGILKNANPEDWLKNLEQADIDYLILFNQPGFDNFETEWTHQNPKKFKQVFSDGLIEIYRLNPGVQNLQKEKIDPGVNLE